MSTLVDKLLAGSPVSRESHPVLVGLLEVAAARPAVPLGSAALQKKFQRQWGHVGEAFGACVLAGVSDVDLAEVLPVVPLEGLASLEVRPKASEVLRLAAGRKALRMAGKGLPGAIAPCRFCGEKSDLHAITSSGLHWVACKCSATGPSMPSAELALLAWNSPLPK